MAGVETSNSGITVLPEFGRPIFFGEPTTEDEEDETSKRIKAALGNFSEFAQTVIKNAHSDHPQMLGIANRESNRDENRRKLELIFSEMKNSIEPLTGLDDLNVDMTTSSSTTNHLGPPPTFYNSNSTVSSRKYTPGALNSYGNQNSHAQGQSILNDTQPTHANNNQRKSQWPLTSSTCTPPKVSYPPYQQQSNSLHHLSQTSHYPPPGSNVASSSGNGSSAPCSLLNSNSTNLSNNLPATSSLSDSDDAFGPSIHSSITNSTVKVNEILAEAVAKNDISKKRKITPLTQQAPQPPQSIPSSSSSSASTTTGPSSLLSASIANSNNNKAKTNTSTSTKLSQAATVTPVNSKTGTKHSSSSEDDSDGSSSDDSDDDSEEEKSSEESSEDDGDSSDSSDSDASKANRKSKNQNKKISKKQSSVESNDSAIRRGGDQSIPVPTSAGLGPPTNAIGNDDWDLDNFIPSDNKPKLSLTNSSTNNNSSIYSRDTQPPTSNSNSNGNVTNNSKNAMQSLSSSSSSNKGQTSRYRQPQKNGSQNDANTNNRFKNRYGTAMSGLASRLSDMEEGEVDSDPEADKMKTTKSSSIPNSTNLLNTRSSSEESFALDLDNPEPYDPSHGRMDMIRPSGINSKHQTPSKYVPSNVSTNRVNNITTNKLAPNSRMPDPSPPLPSVATTNGLSSTHQSASSSSSLLSNKKQRSETPTKLASGSAASSTPKTSSNQARSTKSSSVKLEPPTDSQPEDIMSVKSSKSSLSKQTKTSSSRSKEATPTTTTTAVPPPPNNRSKSSKKATIDDSTFINSNQENIDNNNSTSAKAGKSNKRPVSSSLLNDKEPKKKASNSSKVLSNNVDRIDLEEKSSSTRPEEMKINIELHRLHRIPCLDRNGNLSSSNSRLNDHHHHNDHSKSVTPIKKEEKESSSKSSKSNKSTKESRDSSRVKRDEDEKPPKELMCQVPLQDLTSSARKKLTTSSTPNKKSNTKSSNSDLNEYHLSTNSRGGDAFHSKTNSATSPQVGNSLLAKASPIIARSSPITTNNRSDSSINNRSLDAFPITNMYHPLHEQDALNKAKVLKRNADRENDRHQQMSQYIEAVLFFVQTGMSMEIKRNESDLDKAFQMYKETLNLLKQTTNKFSKATPLASTRPGSSTPDTTSSDVKLTVFSYRCQALLMLKLNRMRSKEMYDNKELISTFMSEPAIQQILSHPSSSSSPSTQIPTNTLQACSKQLTLLQQFQTVIELWTKSEMLIEKNQQAKDWFASLNGSEVGSLLLSSTFEHLINYILNGIRNLNL